MNPSDIQNPIFKAGSVWAAYGISNWYDLSQAAQAIAGVLAGAYSIILISEWGWKKWKHVVRPAIKQRRQQSVGRNG